MLWDSYVCCEELYLIKGFSVSVCVLWNVFEAAVVGVTGMYLHGHQEHPYVGFCETFCLI